MNAWQPRPATCSHHNLPRPALPAPNSVRLGLPSSQAPRVDEAQALIDRNIRRQLGVFSVPSYLSTGDPADKYGPEAHTNRAHLSLRDGLQPAVPHAWWKETILKEHRLMQLKDLPSASSVKSVMNQMDVAAQVPATPPPSTAPTSTRPAPPPPASAPPPAAASAPLPPGGYFAGAPPYPMPPFPARHHAPPSSSGQVQTPPLPPPPGFPAPPPAVTFPLPSSIALPGSWCAPPFPPPSVPPASYYAPQYAPPPAAASQLAQQPHLPSPAATLAYYPTGMIQPCLDGRPCMVYMPCWVYR